MKRTIDLNADLGEDETAEGIARDIAMMDVISSCNIACGGHAGSPETMRKMLEAAQSKSVAAGAHPSYPDRVNFGRMTINISPDELSKSLAHQLNEIRHAASQTGADIHHLKPHGALYNDAQDDEHLAQILIDLSLSEGLALVGMADSILEQMAGKIQLPYISEGFIDRRYTDNARLQSRNEDGAVIAADEDRIAQGLALATGKPILSDQDNQIAIKAETLCLHSDSDGALLSARSMRAALEQANVFVQAVSR